MKLSHYFLNLLLIQLFQYYDKCFSDKYSELIGSTGQIYSPLYPKAYLNYDTFSYKIVVPVKMKIVLSFKEFDLVSEGDDDMECDYVYIEVGIWLT